MKDKEKDRDQLIEEIKALRAQLKELKKTGLEYAKKNLIIQNKREYAENILNTVREPLIILDANLKIVSASRSFYQTFEVKPEETEGRFIYDLGNRQWNIPKLRELLENILPRHKTFDDFQVEHDFPMIGKRVMLLNARWIAREKDKPQIILLALEDITKRKQTEEDSKKAMEDLKRLDQLKSDFVSMASHELRTPMSIIREGVAQVLDGIHGEIAEDQKESLFASLTSIDRLTRLVNSLLDISKIEAGEVDLQKERFDLVSLVWEVSLSFEPAMQNKNLELKKNFPPGKIEIYADKDKIIQVLVNLFSNAIKFTDKGYIEVSVLERQDMAECSVADTGVGISKEDLPKVFNKFPQFVRIPSPAEKGAGLGLALSKGIIDSHGGRIWIESKFGEGSKFSLALAKYTGKELIV